MDGRYLLFDDEKIVVFIDSNTFEKLLFNKNRLGYAILRHHDTPFLRFVRTPFETDYKELKSIPSCQLKYNKKSELSSLTIQFSDSIESHAFDYLIADIRLITEEIYHKKNVTADEIKTILFVFIQAIFNSSSKANICITNNKIILKKRLWFESHFPGGQLNIMSINEASHFLDLFYKKKGKFPFTGNCYFNKGLWYWNSMSSKIPHYNPGDPLIDALVTRFYYSLVAVDEIGIQYYSGVNYDTMDMSLYHFNYLISLITGIFDNLALKTNQSLNINFKDLRSVCLNKKSGKDFLNEIKEKDSTIRELIHKYVCFINVIYRFREVVIHREGLDKKGFENKSETGRWKANFIKIDKGIATELKHIGDKKGDIDPVTNWGIYSVGDIYFLEPFHFSCEAVLLVAQFVDEYLELLGYPLYIDKNKKAKGDFPRNLENFEKFHLGL